MLRLPLEDLDPTVQSGGLTVVPFPTCAAHCLHMFCLAQDLLCPLCRHGRCPGCDPQGWSGTHDAALRDACAGHGVELPQRASGESTVRAAQPDYALRTFTAHDAPEPPPPPSVRLLCSGCRCFQRAPGCWARRGPREARTRPRTRARSAAEPRISRRGQGRREPSAAVLTRAVRAEAGLRAGFRQLEAVDLAGTRRYAAVRAPSAAWRFAHGLARGSGTRVAAQQCGRGAVRSTPIQRCALAREIYAGAASNESVGGQ